MIGRNDPCYCGSGRKWKKCHFPNPGLGSDNFPLISKIYRKKHGILLKGIKEIEGIRKAGHLAAHILEETCKMAKEGVTTNQLDIFASNLMKKCRAIPATLGYGEPPYPKSICTSLNDVICHGIPGDTPLKQGDILNIDVACILDGYFGDCSMMVKIGEVDEEKERVVEAAYFCLQNALKVVKPAVPIYAIGDAIEKTAAEYNCSVVHEFVGHGVGCHFHENPQIPHSKNRVTTALAKGMTFTIEPMINAGKSEARLDEEDEWTAYTIDGKPSAQYEYTLLVTDDSCEILTPWKR